MKFSKHSLILGLIFALAFFLRFYRIGERFSIFGDIGRDVLVAREAVKLGLSHWPLVGSFSSAGPFVFGPIFYWLISLSYLPNFNWLIMPWLLTATVSWLFVWVMYLVGQKFGGQKLGYLTAALAAVSPAQISRATALNQHTFIAIISALTLLSFISYLKKPRLRTLFLMGLAIGFGLSFHYQAVNLFFFPLLLIFLNFNFLKIFKKAAVLIFGLLLPSLPLIFWDSQQNWANYRNLLDYFLIGQYRVYVPNRWLTYLFSFWPNFWASLIGNLPILSVILMVSGLIFIMKDLLTHRLSKLMFKLILVFGLQFLLLRYHHGERFEGYLIYLQPIILLFSAWILLKLKANFPQPTFMLLILILVSSLKANFYHFLEVKSPIPALRTAILTLKTQFPQQSFSLYDYRGESSNQAFGLSLLLDTEGLIDKNKGINLGTCISVCPKGLPVITQTDLSLKIINLSQLPKNQLVKPEWTPINPIDVYEDVALWWQKEPLNSSFSLVKFIEEKVGFK